ncbi:SET-domain-containing protein [Sanghuangporus baumii]|uniref:SET-domain-containing protein n=1 Tax=Sanghuangporus baumii TaxID=108892 RepID=A0A9Q5HS74_SANBA|nr:SET-domain-containing protein [Sanghuangporus baumii]
MSEAEDEAVSSLITSVYNDVWDEFYAWEQDYCASEIHSLQSDITKTDASGESLESESTDIVSPQSFFTNIPASPDSLHWENPSEKVERRDEAAALVDYKMVHLKAPKLNPTPCYESCSSMSTSVFAGDDSDDMPFVPFPGSNFDFAGYRNHHERFAWEKERLDPDKETIILESIRRLNNYHDIPLEHIKRVLLPSVPISKLGQRDLLQWTSFENRHDEIPASPSLPEHWDTKARFDGIVKHFCPNLNCIEAFCSLHEEVPPVGPPNNASAGEKLGTDSGPCGSHCYLSASSTPNEAEEVELNEAIRSTMATILSVCPDLTDCQLAIACNRTCRKTHAIRQKLDLPAQGRTSSIRTDDSGWDDLTNTVINKLAYHVPTRVHATRRRTVLAIVIRRTARRVVDVHHNRTIVKQSKFGFGLFLDQAVHAGELILEYTGEIIYESTVDSRAFFNEFRGRNYVYKLNNTLSIDASKLGNESRFINHDRERVNCCAKYMLVNGVQRIGIYADKHLKPGTELYLDYGNEFFKEG